MGVETVNDHVLFPEPADWADAPDWQREWQNVIAEAVTGAESRNALRIKPRISLSFKVTPCSLVEQTEFDDRIRQAKKNGLACSPYHGRGCVLQEATMGATDTVLVDDRFPWRAGDVAFFRNQAGFYEYRTVETAALDAGIWTLELDEELTGIYPANSFVWLLLFGKFSTADMSVLSPKTGPARITIQELISSRSEQVGEVTPAVGDGIGFWKIGDTFEVQ